MSWVCLRNSFCNLKKHRGFSSFTVDGRFNVPFNPGQTFLAAAEAAGVAIAADCREGKCGKCEVEIVCKDEATSTSENMRVRACVEKAVAGVAILRTLSDASSAPTYFQEKTWTRKEREEAQRRRAAVRAEREKSQNTVEAMKARARKFEEVSGVSLKDDDDEDEAEEEIDWSKPFRITEHEEVARRCMKKHRAVDPRGITVKKLQKLLKALPGYQAPAEGGGVDHNSSSQGVSSTDDDFERALELWRAKHQAEVDKVTFDNCASYEP